MSQKLSAPPTKIVQITCAFCKGRGVDPFGIFSKLSICPACQGRKKVAVTNPYEKCLACKGKGVFIAHRLRCEVCDGRGVVSRMSTKKRCGKCAGGGTDAQTGLPCATCYDLGMV